MICPCKGCNIRTATCHAECQAYLEWQKQNNEYREAVHKKKLRYNEFYNYTQQAMANMQSKEQREIAKKKYKKN